MNEIRVGLSDKQFEKATVPTTQFVTIYLSRVGAAAAVQRTSRIPSVHVTLCHM